MFQTKYANNSMKMGYFVFHDRITASQMKIKGRFVFIRPQIIQNAIKYLYFKHPIVKD